MDSRANEGKQGVVRWQWRYLHRGGSCSYKGRGNLMVAEVLPEATFMTGERRVLFSVHGYGSANFHQVS